MSNLISRDRYPENILCCQPVYFRNFKTPHHGSLPCTKINVDSKYLYIPQKMTVMEDEALWKNSIYFKYYAGAEFSGVSSAIYFQKKKKVKYDDAAALHLKQVQLDVSCGVFNKIW